MRRKIFTPEYTLAMLLCLIWGITCTIFIATTASFFIFISVYLIGAIIIVVPIYKIEQKRFKREDEQNETNR